ncbi:MAG: zinc-binding alcohol dehydrogenase [Chloroflexota bacterium]
MSIQANAVIFTAPAQVQVGSVLVPEPGPGEVRIRTVYSGISQGTERWMLLGRYNRMDQAVDTSYPCYPGYQAAGIVESVGADVSDLRPGDRVIASGTRFADGSPVPPGRASHCAYLTAPRSEVARLGPDADLAAASLFVMAAVGRHGTRLADVSTGERVLVIGQGMIGQMSAQAARRRGAHVVAADLIESRVELSASHSADRAALAAGDALEALVREETEAGFDVVIDTTGNSAMFDTCLALLRREGRLVLQGYYPDPVVIDFHRAHLQRVTVVFPCGWDRENDQQLADDLTRGKPSITPLISHRLNYQQAPEAYRLITDHPDRTLGMVLRWSDA